MSRKSTLTITCWGYYGKQNTGDDLILYLLLRKIQEYSPNANVIVCTTKRETILHLIPAGLYVETCVRSVKGLVSTLKRSDLILCGPGGLFPHKNIAKLLFWNILMCSKHRNFKMGFLGIGIGNSNVSYSLNRYLLCNIIKKSDAFVTRQKNLFASLGMSECISETHCEASDVVFSLPIIKKAQCEKNKIVVFALANIFGGNASVRASFQEKIASIIERLIHEGYQIQMLTFSGEEDATLNEGILACCRFSSKIELIPHVDNPTDVIKYFQEANLCFAMRFHALVIAAICGIPCCGIAYSDKTADLALRLGLSSYFVPFCISPRQYFGRIISLDFQKMQRIITCVLNNLNEISEEIAKKVPILQDEALINWNVLSGLINKLED